MAKGGDVFLLDMGEPIRIFDLAKQMIRLSGYELKDKNNPDGDIEINITGLKKGEKINEELLINGKSSDTLHPKIFRGYEQFIPFEELIIYLEKLNSFIQQNNIESSYLLIKEIVPEWEKEYNYKSL